MTAEQSGGGRATRAHGISAVEDRRRPAAVGAADRRRVPRLRPGRARARRPDRRAANGQPAVRVVGLLDRSGYVFEPRGISRRRLLELTREKDAGALLSALGGKPASAADALTFMAGHAVSRPVLVDVTSDETGRSAAGRASATDSTSCSPTRSRSPARGAATSACSAASTRPGGRCATKPPSARACRSSTRSTSWWRRATASCASKGRVSGTLMYVDVGGLVGQAVLAGGARSGRSAGTPSRIRATT